MDQFVTLAGTYAWLAQAFGVLLFTGVVRFVAGRLVTRAELRVAQTANLWDDALLAALRRPLHVGIWVVGISLAYRHHGASMLRLIFLPSPMRYAMWPWSGYWFGSPCASPRA
jgi:MscS family membrane protein